jgi:membrane-anchored protein YejM (alkaline phosphatase superfamily)
MSLFDNEEERLNNMWASIIVIATVIVLVIVGIALFSRTMSKSRWLKQHGTRVIARVTSTAFVSGSSISKMITAEWTDPRTDQPYTFRSLVPTAFRVKIGETVDVLVDPENPERYSVVSTTSTSMRMR